MLKPVPNPKQFNVSLDPETKKKLEVLAEEFKMGKASKVGATIIETYFERWAIIERRRRQLEDEYHEEMLARIDKMRRPPLVIGEAKNNPTGRKRRKR